MVEINDFTQEKSCVYKGENYLVRDNGAVKRLQREGKAKRKLDDFWTFGSSNETGYLFIASVQVHRIVATAFHGDAPTPQHIVDHIDTNRQNNRPENLRWVTKLENALNNPITRKKIELCCGSIEAFIENPSMLRERCAFNPEISWMHRVTPEEAKIALEHLLEWSKKDDYVSKGGKIGDWIYLNNGTSMYDVSMLRERISSQPHKPFETKTEDRNREINLESQRIWNEIYDERHENSIDDELDIEPVFYKSLTPNVAQENWKTPTEFPMCPQSENATIIDYYNNMTCGMVFSSNTWGKSNVVDFALSEDKMKLFVATENKDAMKEWVLSEVYMSDGCFVHKSRGTFFHRDGLDKYFTLAQGKEWTGGEVFDDLC